MKNIFTAADRMGTIFRLVLLAALTLTLLSAAGCTNSPTKIGDVTANGSNYDGKTITVKGTVGETVWLVTAKKGLYQVGDLSGTIWVYSTEPPPEKGMTVRTEGTLSSAFSLGGRSYGTIINETKRN
jgi:hypothetical protein